MPPGGLVLLRRAPLLGVSCCGGAKLVAALQRCGVSCGCCVKVCAANLLESKVQGALVRSRFQNIAEMDTPSGFFFGLERKNGQKKVIHALLSDAGQELVEPGQIRRRAVEFYRSLYSSEYEEDNTLQEEFCSGLPQVLHRDQLPASRAFEVV
ncbi:hypothetical protein L3Q82_008091 [Scortum barcoo]|uniref:Uncharacterized protein n=1 Tax=Scortum barcoo TaxID=214431 RepID=A0ACB8WKK8_9TELE|nr:hypothetical protein L3Q82_008091 [Scortum barcoo]